MEAEHLFSPRELASLAHTCQATVRAWISKGLLRHVRLGRALRIPASEVTRVLRSGLAAQGRADAGPKATEVPRRSG